MTYKIRRAMAVMESNASIFQRRGDPWDKSAKDEIPLTSDDNPDLDRYYCKTVKPNGKGSLYAPTRKVHERTADNRAKVINALNKMNATLRANREIVVKEK